MRFILDDLLFALAPTDTVAANAFFERLADLLFAVREDDALVEIISGWGALPCMEFDVATVLSDGRLDRDLRVRILGMLGKCPLWDEAEDVSVDSALTIDGEARESFGIAWAATLVSSGIPAVGVTATNDARARTVATSNTTVDVFFIGRERHLEFAWRQTFGITRISEEDFFDLARRCFRLLAFADSLRFSGFHGGYSNLDVVVRHLSVLNDEFLPVYEAQRGNSAEISARLGIDVSIEGATRKSDRLMRLRDVSVGDETYRCEWHSKLQPHINRIHFRPHCPTHGRVLIGIFTDHLAT